MLRDFLFQFNFNSLDKLIKTHVSEFDGGYPQYNFTIDELREMFEISGLKIVDIIGKPIFIEFMNREIINEMLKDKTIFNKLLETENRFNSDPSIAGLGGHIQIVGKKK